MDKSQAQQMQMELLMTLLTTLLFLAMYWWSTLPEWKQEMVIREVKSHLRVPVIGGMSLADRIQIEQFRAEMSRWEHARKRDNSMETRDSPEESN